MMVVATRAISNKEEADMAHSGSPMKKAPAVMIVTTQACRRLRLDEVEFKN